MNDKLLLGELREFKKTMTSEVKELRKDVKSLMSFKWRLIGIAGLASFIATVAAEILRH